MANKIQQEGVHRDYAHTLDGEHEEWVDISGEDASGFIYLLASDKVTKTNSIIKQEIIGIRFDAKINVNQDSDKKEIIGLIVGDFNIINCHLVDKNKTKSRFVVPYEDLKLVKNLIRSAVYQAFDKKDQAA